MAADMTPWRFLALDGDGIGPEIMAATIEVLGALRPHLGRAVSIDRMDIGLTAFDASGTTMPEAVVDAALAADGVLLGPVSHNSYPPRDQGGINPSGTLRKRMELFANLRPARRWEGCAAPARGPLDLIVVRENLEGFYADRNMHQGPGEFMPVPGVALAMRRITEDASRRIAQTAFSVARTRPAKHVTAVHKANVMHVTDGLFLDTVRAVAADFPDVAYDELLVDAAAAHLVRDATRFDVIVTTNMFGDILSDLASELAGGLGLAGSLNLGTDHAAAQAQHGSAPDIAGQDLANPVSLILSLEMLLRHLGEREAANRIVAAVSRCLSDPATRTRDLGGALGTRAFGQTLAHHVDTDDT